LGSGEDQAGKRWDGGTSNIEPCAEVVPVADAELGAGLGEREEGIARIATAIAAGPARDSRTLRIKDLARKDSQIPIESAKSG
jgi:hypothetical protein